MGEQVRNGSMAFAANFRIGSTALKPEGGWHVYVMSGTPDSGEFSRYLTAEQAREVAAKLIESADHYDAETARLAEQAAA